MRKVSYWPEAKAKPGTAPFPVKSNVGRTAGALALAVSRVVNVGDVQRLLWLSLVKTATSAAGMKPAAASPRA